MLRIAVPNKGSLSGPAADMLHEAGYQQRREAKELRIVDPNNEVEFFYLRPRDIAIYVSSGRLDIGITCRDLLQDSGASAEEILPLGFARSTFRYATKPGTAGGVADFTGMTVAGFGISREPLHSLLPFFDLGRQRADLQADVVLLGAVRRAQLAARAQRAPLRRAGAARADDVRRRGRRTTCRPLLRCRRSRRGTSRGRS